MIVTPIKTAAVVPGKGTLQQFMDDSINELKDGTVVAITSKIIGIFEGRVLPIGSADKLELVERESEYFTPVEIAGIDYRFTRLHNTLIPNSGVDESNADNHYVLWPDDPQASANRIRQYLSRKFGLKKLGVLVVDSTAFPLRYGTVSIPIGHSGFLAAKDYRGKKDIFGRTMQVSISSVAGSLAAAAGIVMGEGAEQTPIALISDVPFVKFQDRDPTDQELSAFYIDIFKDDMFYPFLKTVKWQRGGRTKK